VLSERDNYLQRIEDLRGQVRALIADLPAEALNWRPIPPLIPPVPCRDRGEVKITRPTRSPSWRRTWPAGSTFGSPK